VHASTSVVDGERRLLANALLDPKQRPLRPLVGIWHPLDNFTFVYSYITRTNSSFPEGINHGGHAGTGRWHPGFMPFRDKNKWMKGKSVAGGNPAGPDCDWRLQNIRGLRRSASGRLTTAAARTNTTYKVCCTCTLREFGELVPHLGLLADNVSQLFSGGFWGGRSSEDLIKRMRGVLIVNGTRARPPSVTCLPGN